jgi:hypothetical protein
MHMPHDYPTWQLQACKLVTAAAQDNSTPAQMAEAFAKHHQPGLS